MSTQREFRYPGIRQAVDGNTAVTTINAGNGTDFFQVGQVYNVSDFTFPPNSDPATTPPYQNGEAGSVPGYVGALLGDGAAAGVGEDRLERGLGFALAVVAGVRR